MIEAINRETKSLLSEYDASTIHDLVRHKHLLKESNNFLVEENKRLSQKLKWLRRPIWKKIIDAIRGRKLSKREKPAQLKNEQSADSKGATMLRRRSLLVNSCAGYGDANTRKNEMKKLNSRLENFRYLQKK